MFRRLIFIFGLLLIICTTSGVMAEDKARQTGILYTKPLESVIFSHQDHLQKNTSCSTCHSGLFEMEALYAEKNTDFNMDSLYKGKYCGACHNGKKAFASDTQCARCHLGSGIPLPAKDAPAYKKSVIVGKDTRGVAFNHDTHGGKTTCRSCHPSVFIPEEGAAKIRMADHSQSKYCFGCHDKKGKNAFAWNDCSRCHQKSIPSPKATLSFGRGGKAVAFKHQSHQLKAGCKACHPGLFAYKRGVARIDFNDHVSRKSCFTCHAKKNGTAFYDCSRCHKDKPAAKTGGPDTLQYKTPMQNVYFHHESHAVFSCMMCHPAPFAMKKGGTKMVMSEMLHGKTCGVCHNAVKAFHARECAKCHKK